jgi:hypothetical protein
MDVLYYAPLNIEFTRAHTHDKWETWISLVCRLINESLNNELDIFKWCLATFGIFWLKSMYADFLYGHIVFLKTYIWRVKVLLKVKLFMWLLFKKVLSPKMTSLKYIGVDAQIVWSVDLRRQLIICLFHVHSRVLFEG